MIYEEYYTVFLAFFLNLKLKLDVSCNTIFVQKIGFSTANIIVKLN